MAQRKSVTRKPNQAIPMSEPTFNKIAGMVICRVINAKARQTMTMNIPVNKPMKALLNIINPIRPPLNKVIGMVIGSGMNARQKIPIVDKVKRSTLRKIVGRKKQTQYIISSKQYNQGVIYAVSFT